MTDFPPQPERPRLKGACCVVTGSNGFVGSHVVDELVRCGARVRALVRKSSNLRWLEGTAAEVVYGELRSPESLPQVLDGADFVFHVAGVVKARSRETYFQVNAGGTHSLLEACCACGASPRVVLVSSLAAGGPSGRGPAVTEDMPPAPISFYGESKVEAEKIAAGYFDRLPVAIVRPPVIYGPRETDVFQFIKAAVRWHFAPIAGKSDTPLSVIHIADVVRGLLDAALSDRAAGSICYISGPQPVTWESVADAIQEVLGRRVRRLCIPMPVVRASALLSEAVSAVRRKPALFNREKVREILADGWVCSTGKARREIGFDPQVDIIAGMRNAIEWYRAHRWL